MHWYTYLVIYLVGLFICETISQLADLRGKADRSYSSNMDSGVVSMGVVFWPITIALAVCFLVALVLWVLAKKFYFRVYIDRFIKPTKDRLIGAKKKKEWDKKNEEAFRKQREHEPFVGQDVRGR